MKGTTALYYPMQDVEPEPVVKRPETPIVSEPSLRNSLATRLLQVIFGCYFVVTLVVTGVQLVAEYQHTRTKLINDLGAMEATFGPGITNATWSFNTEVLGGILSGMAALPNIVGIKVEDDGGNLIRAEGLVQDANLVRQQADAQGGLKPIQSDSPDAKTALFDDMFSRSFDMVYTNASGQRRTIGHWTVYSSQRFVVKQLQYTFTLILINSIVKTLALWFIFLYVIQRALGKPLRQLTEFVGDLHMDNLANKRIVLDAKGQHELHILATKLNQMVVSLHESAKRNGDLVDDLEALNSTLESQVADRTKELEELSITDQLTGLSNRRKLDEVLQYEGGSQRRYSGPFSVVMGDMDKFKSVNDTHGHQAGDQVLSHLASIFRDGARAVDTVGRWGGEEFMLICPNTNLNGACALAEKLREQVAKEAFPIIGHATCSFGVAEHGKGETIEALIARMDAALYSAKARGRNRVELAQNESRP